MRLKLAVAGKEIGSLPLDAEKAGSWDYLQAKRRLLVNTHHNKLVGQPSPPEFYIEVPSKMNKPKKR